MFFDARKNTLENLNSGGSLVDLVLFLFCKTSLSQYWSMNWIFSTAVLLKLETTIQPLYQTAILHRYFYWMS